MSNFNQQLKSKTVLITGATSGIGEAVAKYLATIGLNIVIFGRSGENGKRVEKEINELNGGKSLFVQGDVTSEKDVHNALEQGESKFGGIHFVFGNAGVVGPLEGLLNSPIEEIKKLFDINLFGAYITLQQSVPFLKKTGSGAIVFNSSFIGPAPRFYFKNPSIFTNYAISKSSLDGLIKVSTSLEKSDNVRVYSVNPSAYPSGMTNTDKTNAEDLAKGFNVAIKKAGNPTDIGRVLEHIFDGSTKYLNGTGIVCENDVTFSSQFLYDHYTTEEAFSVDDLIRNHLNDVKGDKLGEKRISEIIEGLKKFEQEVSQQQKQALNQN